MIVNYCFIIQCLCGGVPPIMFSNWNMEWIQCILKCLPQSKMSNCVFTLWKTLWSKYVCRKNKQINKEMVFLFYLLIWILRFFLIPIPFLLLQNKHNLVCFSYPSFFLQKTEKSQYIVRITLLCVVSVSVITNSLCTY